MFINVLLHISTMGLHIGRELTGNVRADAYVTHGRVDMLTFTPVRSIMMHHVNMVLHQLHKYVDILWDVWYDMFWK